MLPTTAFGKESESKRPPHNVVLVCYYSRLTHSPPTHITFTLQYEQGESPSNLNEAVTPEWEISGTKNSA